MFGHKKQLLIPAVEGGVYSVVYRIAICDDEEDFIRLLAAQVSELLDEKGVEYDIVTFHSGELLLKHLTENSAGFDLFFLDVFMKEINGVDTAYRRLLRYHLHHLVRAICVFRL